MPKIRSIHYDAWKSRKLAACSDGAERLYWLLQPYADDEGRFEDDCRVIWGTVMVSRDGWSPERVAGVLAELTAVGLAVHYEVDGLRYFEFVRFDGKNGKDGYQKPKYWAASTLPGPDEGAIVPPPPPDDPPNVDTTMHVEAFHYTEPASPPDEDPIEPPSNPRRGEVLERSCIGDGEVVPSSSSVTSPGVPLEAAVDEDERTKKRRAIGIVSRRRHVTARASEANDPGAYQRGARIGIGHELEDAALDEGGVPATAEAWADLIEPEGGTTGPSWEPDPACEVCHGDPFVFRDGDPDAYRCPRCYPPEFGDAVLPSTTADAA